MLFLLTIQLLDTYFGSLHQSLEATIRLGSLSFFLCSPDGTRRLLLTGDWVNTRSSQLAHGTLHNPCQHKAILRFCLWLCSRRSLEEVLDLPRHGLYCALEKDGAPPPVGPSFLLLFSTEIADG